MALVLSAVCFYLGAHAYYDLARRTRSTTIKVEDQAPVSIKLPYERNDDHPINFTATTVLSLNDPQNYVLAFSFDDCLTALKINDISVTLNKTPNCEWDQVLKIPAWRIVPPGASTIVASVRNLGGPGKFDLQILPTHRALTCSLFFVFAGILLLSIWFSTTVCGARTISFVTAVIFLGLALRIFCLLYLPLDTEGPDIAAHTNYLRYATNAWQLPRSANNYEFYQPPLYYWIIARGAKVFDLMRFSQIAPLTRWYTLSVSLGCASFLVASGVLANHFGKGSKILYLPIALLASLPGFVVSSVRIDNDCMMVFWGLCALWCLQKYWSSRRLVPLCAGAIAVSVALMTKSNALILLPALLILPLLDSTRRVATRYKIIVCLLIGVLMVFTCYSVKRFEVDHTRPHIIPPRSLNSWLRVDQDFASYLTFNPASIWEIPIFDPWKDAYRRKYLWEYLYRSTLFQEDQILPGMRWIAVVGFIPLSALLYWLVLGWYDKRAWPLLIVSVSALLGIVYLRALQPYACHQDFRLISFASPAFIAGIVMQTERIRRSAARIFLYASYVLCAGLFVMVVLMSNSTHSVWLG